MKLLEWVDYQVRVTPEALLVRPIRKLYNADRTQRKEQFMQQMSYLFFMVDPRSTYMYIVDEEEREHQIKLQEGLPDDFKPSKDLLEAMEIYGKHVITSSTRLLEATRSAADALKDELDNTKKLLQERTDKGARVTKANDVIDVMNKLLKVIPQLQDLEKKVDSEIRENTRARGNTNSMFEDGV